ncbi:S46 family peptidase [Gemmatimonadota bacterium]
MRIKTVNQWISAACLAVVAGACAPSASAPAQTPAPVSVRVDTVFLVDTVTAAPMFAGAEAEAGRFDNGKMWTFEYPPMEYFAETYGFTPDSAWFQNARLGSLRLPNCTASFVSPTGLVLTNHHCARESVSQVSEEGETLLDDGFYAETLADERPVEDLYLDQLMAIVDVTEEVDAAPGAARDSVTEQISERIAAEHRGSDSVVVEMISLWNGAKTSAYVFKRFTDLRLVLAPELQLGAFGGDPDNFTYPRYSLDMSFFRVYDEGGEPYAPEFFFPWSLESVTEGDAVFMIGNPGSTSRLQTVAELEFRRDVGDKATLDFITNRVNVLQSFVDDYPEEAEERDMRNEVFSLQNQQKAMIGMAGGLADPVIVARRQDNEDQFRAAIDADAALSEQYGGLIDQLAAIQEQKAEYAADLGAFLALGNPDFDAAIINRGILGFQYVNMQGGGAPAEMLADLKDNLRAVAQQPRELQRRLLAARLAEFEHYFGVNSDVVRQILAGRSPEAAAQAILEQSVLTDSARAISAMEGGMLTGNDPAIQMITAIVPRIGPFQNTFARLTEEEESITRQIGRARFEIYGTTDPPDATFSLRIADGLVLPYEYNGTVAPIHTTFWGLYDRFYSFGPDGDWNLPERWRTPPPDFDLSTPLNFVSTADIIGGNSGSPVINTDLELVGVVFDGNIESLPGDYIYLPESNRAVTVDAGGIMEALEHIYRAERIVAELRAGQRRR